MNIETIQDYICSNILVLMGLTLFFIALMSAMWYYYEGAIAKLKTTKKRMIALRDSELFILRISIKACESANRWYEKENHAMEIERNSWKTSASAWMKFNADISLELESTKQDLKRMSHSFNVMASKIAVLKRRKK